MPIGRPLDLTANVTRKDVTVTATEGQTQFTVTGGYRINELGVYRNGVRLVSGTDYTATDGSIVTLLSAATAGDVVNFQIFDSFNIADAIDSILANETNRKYMSDQSRTLALSLSWDSVAQKLIETYNSTYCITKSE